MARMIEVARRYTVRDAVDWGFDLLHLPSLDVSLTPLWILSSLRTKIKVVQLISSLSPHPQDLRRTFLPIFPLFPWSSTLDMSSQLRDIFDPPFMSVCHTLFPVLWFRELRIGDIE